MKELPAPVQQRLGVENNIWIASVRPDGRPHLVPIWFVYSDGKLYICTDPVSVKSRNIRQNPQVVLALESGSSPVICEGMAAVVPAPWPVEVKAAFQQKYNWDISDEEQYTALIEVTPVKWLAW